MPHSFSYPVPPNEADRQAVLESYNVFDAGPNARLDVIVQQAARLFAVPIALISLVDRNRLWFKARIGVDCGEMPREMTFCSLVILQDQPMMIPDTWADPRFAENPLVVGAPFVRFYAGAPLIAPGRQKLGALCLIDRRPRLLSPGQLRQMERLARRIMILFEVHKAVSAIPATRLVF